MTMRKIETRAVLAAAYRGGGSKSPVYLTHAVDAQTGEPLCKRVKADHIADRCADDPHTPPTCARCMKLDPRTKSAGGFLLGSLLQF